jgi:hypothetical protein
MNASINDIQKFVSFAAKKLGLTSLPKINFVGSKENSMDAFGHFENSRNKTTITVRITDRHPIDIMRTIAHELIHYRQKVMGNRSSEGMKEDEANALAGRIMRDFDTTHSKSFRDKPIREDMGIGGLGSVAANATGPAVAGFDPLMGMKRKRPVERKKLRDILKKG